MSQKRRNHSAAFKAGVALEAIKDEQTLSELSARFGIHPTQIQQWKRQLVERSKDIFGASEKERKHVESEVKDLHAKISQNEYYVLISSANLLSVSFENSFEAGVSSDDYKWRMQIQRYVDRIIDSNLTHFTTEDDLIPHKGHCIRCGKPIQLDPTHPYCIDCYKSDENIPREKPTEKFCHNCSDHNESTLNEPLCPTCGKS